MGIIIKPIVTEKMTAQSEKLNVYGFIVDRGANKLQIKAAVEQMYRRSRTRGSSSPSSPPADATTPVR